MSGHNTGPGPQAAPHTAPSHQGRRRDHRRGPRRLRQARRPRLPRAPRPAPAPAAGRGARLRLTGPVLAAIFLGQITRWNDPAITALNPGITLPPAPITVVHRADGCGTTYIFSNYLKRRLCLGGPGGPVELLRLLITEAIWLVVFRRSYTVHVRTNDDPLIKVRVRLPSEMAAYHAAAQLVSRFQGDRPVALQSWRAETSASTRTVS